MIIYRIRHAARGARYGQGPAVISDVMDPVKSMLDGRMYDSKSALRATYRQAGVTEVGNDPAIHRKAPKPKPDRQEIKAAVHKAFSKTGL